jgi:hypothetical protein
VDVQAPEVAAQIITLDQTIAVTQTWVVELFLDKAFQGARELDLIVKAKIVTKQEAVAEQVVLDSVLKMTATRDVWVKVVRVQPTIF